jgi:acetyl-CoA acyltransferase 1
MPLLFLCAGLQAIAQTAASIRAGYYTIGIAGGVESMTTNPMAWEGAVNPRVAESQCAQDCLLPMGACDVGWVLLRFGVG